MDKVELVVVKMEALDIEGNLSSFEPRFMAIDAMDDSHAVVMGEFYARKAFAWAFPRVTVVGRTEVEV